MNLNRVLLVCTTMSMALWTYSAKADDVTVTLDLSYSSGVGSAGSWQLFGRVDNTAGPADGQFGLSAVRTLLDNIDFGASGDAIALAPGNGAIDPLDPGGPNERPPALQQLGTGTIDLVYGQDTSGSAVFNVGNSGDRLLASGTFAAGSIPSFGVDNTGPTTLFTQALFLNSSGTGGVIVDNTFTSVTLTADYNGNGVVDAADYTIWRDTLGSTSDLAADGSGNGFIDASDYTVWKNNFGVTLGAGASASVVAGTNVPEPNSLILGIAMSSLVLFRRRNCRSQTRRHSRPVTTHEPLIQPTGRNA